MLSLIKRFEEKGLIIHDRSKAVEAIEFVGYHRLSHYFQNFYSQAEENNACFITGTQFNTIWDLYLFDHELRLLTLHAISWIEIAFRAVLSDVMSLQYGAHWYLDRTLFVSTFDHQKFLGELEKTCNRTDEPKMRQYFKEFTIPKLPPSWAVFEMLAFGDCTTLYRNLAKNQDRKAVAARFGFHPKTIQSWMEALRMVRNICAHHGRLWNRWFVDAPALKFILGDHFTNGRRFYAQALVIQILLQKVHPEFSWKNALQKLFAQYPKVSTQSMDFPKEAFSHSIWN